MMKFLSGLFHVARKRISVSDGNENFKATINEIVEKKDSLSDDEIKAKIESLKEFTSTLPESEDKEKLNRFLDDFIGVKEQDSDTAKEAANLVITLFEKLDTAASSEVPIEETVEKKTETTETETKDEQQEKETKDNDGANAPNDTTKDDNGAKKIGEMTPEELIALLKDVFVVKETIAADEGTKTDDGKDCNVTDNAPIVAIGLTPESSKGSLSEMFLALKGGK